MRVGNLHEMTHLTQIAGTSDCMFMPDRSAAKLSTILTDESSDGGYGYNFVRSLTAAQNIRHADKIFPHPSLSVALIMLAHLLRSALCSM